MTSLVDPPAIQSLWIGGELSTMEQLSISSFLKNGHAFHLYVYDEVRGVPGGTDLKAADQIIPSTKIFRYKDFDSYAGFSNLFRYKLLFEKGGYWVDTDLICLKPFMFEQDYVFTGMRSRRLFGLRKEKHISNWILKAPIGSEIMGFCYQEAENRDPQKLKWGETGPRLVTMAVRRFGLQNYVVPNGTFCPCYASQWKEFISGSFIVKWKWRKSIQNAFGVHLYNEIWRRNSVDKNASYPPNSIYEQLKRRYLEGP